MSQFCFWSSPKLLHLQHRIGQISYLLVGSREDPDFWGIQSGSCTVVERQWAYMYSSAAWALKKKYCGITSYSGRKRAGKKTRTQKHTQNVKENSQTAFPQLLPVFPLLLSKVFLFHTLYYLTKFTDTHEKQLKQNYKKSVFSQC